MDRLARKFAVGISLAALCFSPMNSAMRSTALLAPDQLAQEKPKNAKGGPTAQDAERKAKAAQAWQKFGSKFSYFSVDGYRSVHIPPNSGGAFDSLAFVFMLFKDERGEGIRYLAPMGLDTLVGVNAALQRGSGAQTNAFIILADIEGKANLDGIGKNLPAPVFILPKDAKSRQLPRAFDSDGEVKGVFSARK